MSQDHIEAPSYKMDIERLGENELVFDREHYFSGKGDELDCFGDFWSIAYSEIPTQTLKIKVNQSYIDFSGLWMILIPPHSIINWYQLTGVLKWKALISRDPYPDYLPGLATAYQPNQPIQPLYFSTALESLSQLRAQYVVEHRNDANPHSLKFKKIIDQNFRKDISLMELGKLQPLNYSTVCRAFKKTYGLSPVEYRSKKRILQSMSDLMFGDKALAQTRTDIGIHDASNFTKDFKYFIGVIPKKFQKSKSL